MSVGKYPEWYRAKWRLLCIGIWHFTWVSTEKQLSAHLCAKWHWPTDGVVFIQGHGNVRPLFDNSDCVPLHLAHQVRRLTLVSKPRLSPHNSWPHCRGIISENKLKGNNSDCRLLCNSFIITYCKYENHAIFFFICISFPCSQTFSKSSYFSECVRLKMSRKVFSLRVPVALHLCSLKVRYLLYLATWLFQTHVHSGTYSKQKNFTSKPWKNATVTLDND